MSPHFKRTFKFIFSTFINFEAHPTTLLKMFLVHHKYTTGLGGQMGLPIKLGSGGPNLEDQMDLSLIFMKALLYM